MSNQQTAAEPTDITDEKLAEIRETNPELAKTLESFLAAGHASATKEDTQQRPEPEPPAPNHLALAKVVQLHLWGEARRAAPNAFFRSALFPALNFKEQRPLFREQQRIFAISGIEAFFNGERFDQSDLDVYLELLDLVCSHPLGTECSFTAHGMLKRLNRQTGLSDHEWLHRVLIRLCTSTIDITDHKKRVFGHLIEGGLKDELDKHYRITINPKFGVLFGFGMWSSIDRDQRYALGRDVTAKALHTYYSTHAAPSAHKFETLTEITGRQDSNKPRLRAHIIKAHEHLKKVGFLRDYSVSENGSTIKVHINPTPGQAHHIVKKVIRERRKRTQRPTE
jgi:hypothetical protein